MITVSGREAELLLELERRATALWKNDAEGMGMAQTISDLEALKEVLDALKHERA